MILPAIKEYWHIKNFKWELVIPAVCIIPLTLIGLFFDTLFFEFIDTLRNPLFDRLAEWISESESLVVVLILTSGVFLYQMGEKLWMFPLLSAMIVSGSFSYLIKWWVGRPRPYQTLEYFGFIDTSFPSAHAAVAFAAAAILEKKFQKVAWFYYLFAIGIALSRIYIGMHFLSDVIAGSCFGYLVGKCILWCIENSPFQEHYADEKRI